VPEGITVKDVARAAGVSTATVSRVLHGSQKVTQSTSERVLQTVESLGFVPTQAARNLRQQRTGNIAFVIPSIVNPFFPELVSQLHPTITQAGYSLLLIDAEESEREALRVAGSRLADGVLVVGSTSQNLGVETWGSAGVPVVAIDRAPAALRGLVVQCENELGAREVVGHLIDQGHTSIAHVAGPDGVDVATDRTRGYTAAMAELDIPADPSLIASGYFSKRGGYEATLDLLDKGAKFTALFAANDMQALGGLFALQERGFDVPGDVAVAGFDGIDIGDYVSPALTTYVQPIATIAQQAAELLLAQITDALSFDQERTYRFEGELLLRESTLGRKN